MTIRAAKTPRPSAAKSWPRRPARARSATASRRFARPSGSFAPTTCSSSPARATKPARSSAQESCPSPTTTPSRRHSRTRFMPDAPLWRFPDFVAAMEARVRGAAPAHVTGISIDSRTLAPGDAFFAIRGERFDGHDFVAAAFRAGASAAVVAEARLGGLDLNGALCLVRDPLESLAALARAARARARARVIAVTGSVGKTGTKEALRLALARRGEVHASAASHNNHWGVPLSLARLPANAPYAVFEIGMNHAGEITPLTRLVRPHVAVITTVEPVHLEFFDSVEAIAEAKAEIFSGLGLGGTAVLNRDNVHFDLLARPAREAGARLVSFGAHEAADVLLLDLALEPGGS